MDTISSHPDLSVNNILLYSVLFSALWTYLWFNPKQQMRTRKWQTYWQLGGYSTFLLLGIKGVITEDLVFMFHNLNKLWSYPPILNPFSRAYFEIEIAWYLSQLYALAIDSTLKDFWIMLLHHLITPLEIYYSYQCGYGAIGMCVMFLHDTSDFFLHFAKTLKVFEQGKLTDIFFAVFAASFFITRLVLLPIFPYAYYFTEGTHQTPCGNVLGISILVLILLHCFWFYLILRMIIRFAKVGNVEKDIREGEDDDEKEFEDEKKKDM